MSTTTDASHFSFPLNSGEMHLSVTSSEYPLDEMLDLAERQNPKRAFLFVSKVLGRHIPVLPSRHRNVLHQLARKVVAELGDQTPVLVMGFAETAVGLGAGIHDEICAITGRSDMMFLPSTRHPGASNIWFSFSEDHSHATSHHVLWPDVEAHRVMIESAKTLVLVDDEATTGNTYANLLMAMMTMGGKTFDRVYLVSLTDWSDSSLCTAISLRTGMDPVQIIPVSLTSGSWKWVQEVNAPVQNLPEQTAALSVVGIPNGIGDWRKGIAGRTSVDTSSATLKAIRRTLDGTRILVIGTGENVWHPFRLAEDLERDGYDVDFLATTRSPVLPGRVIARKATFSDHYGIGIPMYLHNVVPDLYERILLMIEREDLDGLCPALTGYLDTFTVVTPSGVCLNFLNGTLQT